jgi:predicted short-subunit dehydrogenase-like oxidoreductase (DUF2520 family)
MNRFCVLGPGRVGCAFAARLAERGRDVEFTRDPAVAAGAGVVIVTVPDRSIEQVAARIPDGPWVVHCAGALGLDVLGPARLRALSVHPLMTFAPGGDASQLDGAYAAVSGRDAEGIAAGFALAHLLGLHPFALDEERRPLYHAAAVLASNAVSTLVAAASHSAQRAGLDASLASEALAPLMRRALDNALADQDGFGLTGPVARGDAATVSLHLAALRAAAPEVEQLYRAVAAATVELLAREREAELREVLAAC